VDNTRAVTARHLTACEHGCRPIALLYPALEGYTVVGEAADGREALKALRARPYPLVVLLGHMIPVMTGLEVLEIVAQDTALATQHVYVMVRGSKVEGASILRQLHVPFVPKPFTVAQLLPVIEEAANRLPREELPPGRQ
jgi:CheY-like chemotaxis protein